LADVEWYRRFAFCHLLRQSVLLPPNVQPTPLLEKINILDATLPSQNGNSNQASRSGDHKRERDSIAKSHHAH
jgi:hypothetical protein